MLKRFRVPTLALATALAVAAPTLTLARDRDDHRGAEHFEHRDDHRFVRDRGHDVRFGFGVGVNVAPAAGYYDQFGVWHPYGFYDTFGVWHAY